MASHTAALSTSISPMPRMKAQFMRQNHEGPEEDLSPRAICTEDNTPVGFVVFVNSEGWGEAKCICNLY